MNTPNFDLVCVNAFILILPSNSFQVILLINNIYIISKVVEFLILLIMKLRNKWQNSNIKIKIIKN